MIARMTLVLSLGGVAAAGAIGTAGVAMASSDSPSPSASAAAAAATSTASPSAPNARHPGPHIQGVVVGTGGDDFTGRVEDQSHGRCFTDEVRAPVPRRADEAADTRARRAPSA